MTKLPRLLIILSLISLLACSRDDSTRRHSETAGSSLLQIYDSVESLSPAARPMIDSALAAAPDSLTYYEYLVLHGRLYLHTSHPDSAMDDYRRVVDFARRQPDSRRSKGLLAIAFNGQAAYYHLLRRNEEESIRLYKEAYRLARQSDLIDFLPEIAANLGDAYIMKNDLPTGAACYRRALYLVDSLQLPQTKNITLYMGLGQVYTTLQDYDTALNYYQLTDRLYNQMVPRMQSYFLNNYGNCYYFMGDYKKALELFLRMKRHIEKYDGTDGFDMHLCMINLSDVYLNLHQTDSARKYVMLAEDYFRKQQVVQAMDYANLIRIGIALQDNRLDEAHRLFSQQGHAGRLEYNLRSIHDKYLNEYFERTGDYRRAYENLKHSIALHDSTEHNRQHMRAAEIMMRLQQDTLKLHRLLEAEEHKAYASRTRTALWALLAFVLVMGLAFYAYYSHTRKLRMQDSMDVMRLKLANARNRISPHFIFNVLNCNMAGDAIQLSSLNQLSLLIRRNLDLTDKAYVTLKEEMDFVRLYLEVESPMLQPDFTYEFDLPPEGVLSSIRVPSMMVQILVENAVVHALKGKQGKKYLCVRAKHDDRATSVSVIDNGQGFDIRHREGRTTKNGLRIITHTVQLTNEHNKAADQMHFSIQNINNGDSIEGCVATIVIPNNIKYV